MAGYQRIIFNGSAGERWKNETGRVQYQLLASWDNTCGVCAQYDRAIGPAWPLPYHRNCRCRMVAVVPGERAEPFIDFRAEAAKLDDSQKKALVGAANYRLVQSGVINWTDVVTPHRVRPLREVVALRKLSVDQLTKAGVARPTADKAWASVNTPEHQLVERHRAELVSSLQGAGLDRRTIAELAAEGIAERVAIGGGPSGPGRFPTTPTEDRLRRFLATWLLRETRPPEPEKAPEPEKTPTPEPEPKTRIAVEVKGGASEEEAQRLAGVLADALPEWVNRKLRAKGVSLIFVEKLEDEKGEAVKETPSGWDKGMTWENCEAYYDPVKRSPVIAKTYVSPYSKETVESKDVIGSVFHEAGHAIDHADGYESRTYAFRIVHEKDKAEIQKNDAAKRDFSYFIQEGMAGQSEAFAELTAYLHGHPSHPEKKLDYRKWFPNVIAHLEKYYADKPSNVAPDPAARSGASQGPL